MATRLQLDDLVNALGAVQERVAVAGGDRVHQARRAQGRTRGFGFARRLHHRQSLQAVITKYSGSLGFAQDKIRHDVECHGEYSGVASV